MTVYDPLIPAANELISDSQADIQNNFSELNTLYAVDHQQWNASTSAFRGKHKKMTFPEAYTTLNAPALGSDLAILYPQIDPVDGQARPQLYYKNTTETQQVTNRFHSIASGYWMMPGGTAGNPSLIYMWGKVPAASFTNAAGAAFFTVTLPALTNYVYTGPQIAGFPNNLLNVQLTLQYDDGINKVCHVDNGGSPPTKESFRILTTVTNASFDFVYWFAIGN
jgi:hypothetical protein